MASAKSTTSVSSAAETSGKLEVLNALARLARLARETEGDPPLVAVGIAIGDWYDRGAEASIDAALGLQTQGGASPSRIMAQATRDRQIVALWRRSPDWRDLSPWAASCLMSASAKRYEAARWPRDRETGDPPSAEPMATWWRILSVGQQIPGARRLQQILDPPVEGHSGL